jgi:hypothetical protein
MGVFIEDSLSKRDDRHAADCIGLDDGPARLRLDLIEAMTAHEEFAKD